MGFAEYPEIKEVYVLHHTQGFGVMESELITLEAVGQSDSESELIALGNKLYPRSGSGWDYDGWVIHINTCTVIGKELSDEYWAKAVIREKEWDDDMELHPDKYIVSKYGEHKIRMKKFPALDDYTVPSSPKRMFMVPSSGNLLADNHEEIMALYESINQSYVRLGELIRNAKPNTNENK